MGHRPACVRSFYLHQYSLSRSLWLSSPIFTLSCLVMAKDTCLYHDYSNRDIQGPLERQRLNLLTSEGWLLLLLLFSHQAVSSSSRPHGLQHTRLPCPSPSPRVCSSSCPLNQWCHPTVSSSVNPLLLLLSIFPTIRVFSNESAIATETCLFGFFSYLSLPCLQFPNSQKFGEGIWAVADWTGVGGGGGTGPSPPCWKQKPQM